MIACMTEIGAYTLPCIAHNIYLKKRNEKNILNKQFYSKATVLEKEAKQVYIIKDFDLALGKTFALCLQAMPSICFQRHREPTSPPIIFNNMEKVALHDLKTVINCRKMEINA